MRSTRLATLAAAAIAIASCDDSGRPAHGNATSLIVVAADSVWAEVGDEIVAALEPRIFTVRDETTFDVTHISPLDPAYSDLRRFRQVLPIGLPGDFWVEAALEEANAVEGTAPRIVEAQDVWSRGQGVTAIVVPPESPAEAVRSQLDELGDILDERFRSYALSRMFVTRADTALRDTLRNEFGFGLVVPNVYRRTDMGQTQVFRNHAELGGELMRTITVTWRPGLIAAASREQILAWRDSVGTYAYDLRQAVDTTQLQLRDLGGGAVELQGVWTSSDPSWPAAGPFIDRVVPCPAQDRTYYLDSWLYAPGKKKYEYMIQLNTILDSFRCGDSAPASAADA